VIASIAPLLQGNAKAVAGAVASLLFALAAAAEGGLALAEVLFAVGAMLGGGALVRQVPNVGPLANATEVLPLGYVPSLGQIAEAATPAVMDVLGKVELELYTTSADGTRSRLGAIAPFADAVVDVVPVADDTEEGGA
jgi:hypothetical protein